MWEKKLLSAIPDSQNLSRYEIFQLFKTLNNSISYNSLGWILNFGLKSNIIYKVGSDLYSKNKDTRKEYSPKYSEYANNINKKIQGQFPELKYTMFETLLLNEFVNHLYSKNNLVIQVEKKLCPFTFDFFAEEFPGTFLFTPSKTELEKYTYNNSIIVENLSSEPPINKEKPHSITIEKLLVDCVTDKSLKTLIPRSEIQNIFQNASLVYKIDLVKIRRYARRHNAWEKIETLLKGEANSDK